MLFRSSLLGFEPAEDYQHLVIEGRGRRLSSAAPDQSLLVQKSTGQLPHGGGVRIAPNSDRYRVLVEWIRQGARFDGDSAIKLESLTVHPSDAITSPNTEVHLRAIARYADNSERDVTDLALFESNDAAMATADESGKVRIGSIPGSVSVMVR